MFLIYVLVVWITYSNFWWGIPSAANVRVVNPVREFGSQGFGNVAWKERVDGWKVKQERNIVPTSAAQTASEGRGGGDIDASTDVFMDDALLLSF